MPAQTEDTQKPITVELTHRADNLQLRLLHVDDDVCFLNIAKKILEADGDFSVVQSTSVEDALRKLKEESFDAVVSDYQMPEKDGLEFLELLKEQNSDIPFILFTGKGREEIVIKALNSGADGYINKQGNPETVYGELIYFVRQAVEKKRSEIELRKSEAELGAQFYGSPDQMFILNRSHKFVRINRTHWFSFAIEDLIGKDSIQFLPSSIREEAKTKIDRCLATGEIQEFECCMGNERWVRARVVPLKINDQVLIISTETTTQKSSEDALRKSEERFRNFADSLQEAVFEIDANGKLTYANKKALEITGYTFDDFSRRGVYAKDFLVENDKKRGSENIMKALQNALITENEYTFRRKNGSIFPALVKSGPILSEGKIVGLVGIILRQAEPSK